MVGDNSNSIQNDSSWLTRFKQNPYIKQVATLLSGTAFAQVITLLAAPILSRLYTPAQIGELTVLNSVSGIGIVIATMKYEMSIVVADDEEQADLLTSASIIIASIVSGFTLFLVTMELLFFQDVYESWHLFIPFTIFIQAAFYTFTFRANFSQQYKGLSISKILQATSNNIWAIGISFFSKPLLLLAPLAGFLIGSVSLKKYAHFNLDYQKMKAALLKHKKYALFTMPSSLLDVASQQIPIFAITFLFSKEFTGHYGMAIKVLYLPATFLGAAVSQVFFKSFAERWKQPGHADFGLLVKTWGVLALIGIVPFGLLFLYGENLFTFVFGSNWADAGKIAAIMTPMIYVIFFSGPSSTAMLVQNKHHISFFFGLASLIYRPLCLYYGYREGDLFAGLKLWVILEVIQVLIYNLIIGRNCWKKSST